MNSLEKQDRLRNLLRTKRGPELVTALIEEIVLLAGEVADLTDDVKALRSYQELSAPLFKADRRPRTEVRPASVTVNAAQLFEPGRGFYALEHDAAGTPFRWTGPERDFSISLYVDRRQPLELRLLALYLMNPNVQTELTLVVDGYVMPLKLAGTAGGLWAGRVQIPAAAGFGATTIIISVPEVFLPKGTDRALGIAFHELTIGPPQDSDTASAA